MKKKKKINSSIIFVGVDRSCYCGWRSNAIWSWHGKSIRFIIPRSTKICIIHIRTCIRVHLTLFNLSRAYALYALALFFFFFWSPLGNQKMSRNFSVIIQAIWLFVDHELSMQKISGREQEYTSCMCTLKYDKISKYIRIQDIHT